MRESQPKAARGAVNFGVAAASSSAYRSSQQANSTSGAPAKAGYGPGGADETLNSQEFDRQRRQLLGEDSQIDEGNHAHSHPPRWDNGAKKTLEFANSQLARRTTIDLTNEPKKDTPYSQSKAPRGPLVSETQLQALFNGTQFEIGRASWRERVF